MTTAKQAQDLPGGTATLARRSVARIGFGAMQLGSQGSRPEAAIAILRSAAGAGVNHIDTAQFYGSCNELIRAALHPYPEDLALVTKVGAERDEQAVPIPLVPAQRPEQLRASVEANLATLGAERLAVVNLRRLDARPGLLAEGDQIVDLDSQLAELSALRDEGKIDGIGLSNVTAGQLQHALPAGIACVQNAYSLLDRSSEPVLGLCAEQDIAFVPYFPLGSRGFPGIAKVTEHPAVIAAAASIDATPAQVGLAWLLAHDRHILLIAGTASTAHLAENIAAGKIRLDAQTMAELDSLPAKRSPGSTLN